MISAIIISAILGVIGTVMGATMSNGTQNAINARNERMQRETNEQNQLMQAQANQAQHAEAQLAYDRSKATNQLSLMQNAGMTKGAALNALTGGGSYTPAPQSASTDQAPKHDADGYLKSIEQLVGGASNTAQRIDEMKRFNAMQKLEYDKMEFADEQARKAHQEALALESVRQESASMLQVGQQKHEKDMYDNSLPVRDQKLVEEYGAELNSLINSYKSRTDVNQRTSQGLTAFVRKHAKNPDSILQAVSSSPTLSNRFSTFNAQDLQDKSASLRNMVDKLTYDEKERLKEIMFKQLDLDEQKLDTLLTGNYGSQEAIAMLNEVKKRANASEHPDSREYIYSQIDKMPIPDELKAVVYLVIDILYAKSHM